MHGPSPLSRLPENRESRWEILEAFLADWYSDVSNQVEFSPQHLRTHQQRLGASVPSAFFEWYELAGNRTRSICGAERMLSPAQWYLDEKKLIFMSENQGGVRWAIDIEHEGEDTPVWLDTGDGKPWQEAADSVSRFALQTLAHQLQFAQHRWWVHGESQPALHATIAATFPQFEFKSVGTMGKVYGYNDLVISFDCGDWIHACAQSQTALETFEELANDEVFRVQSSWRNDGP